MRSAVTTGVLAFVVAAAVLVTAGPASAKGPVSAMLTGPGIDDPIDVLEAISTEDTGMWHALSEFVDPAVLESEPKSDLGPRYTLVWEVMSGPDKTTPIRQDLYLEAEGGPVAHTAPGQPFIDGVTSEQWYRMPTRVRDALAEEGVLLDGMKPVTPAAAVKTKDKAASDAEIAGAVRRPAVDPGTERDPGWPAATAVAGGAAVLGAGGVVMARRLLASRQRRLVDVTRL
jgi:hypothetical protein